SRYFVLAAAAAGLAACEDTSAPSALDREINLAVAQASGQTVANDLSAGQSLEAEATSTGTFLGLTDGASLDQMGPSAGPRPPMGCNFLPGFIRFDCGKSRRGPGGRLGDREFSRTVQYFDAAGAAQTGYDTLTTARIVWQVADTGSFTRRRGPTVLEDSSARSRRTELSNLAGHPDTLRIWNGTGSAYHFTSRQNPGGTRTVEMVASDTTTNVRYRLPRSANPYPLTGTIVRNVSVTRVRTPNDADPVTNVRTRRVVIEFNGTSTATLTVNGEVFDLDLESGEVTPRTA
nr:hypothetical protein [Gemmatimonadaceae bacterium]